MIQVELTAAATWHRPDRRMILAYPCHIRNRPTHITLATRPPFTARGCRFGALASVQHPRGIWTALPRSRDLIAPILLLSFRKVCPVDSRRSTAIGKACLPPASAAAPSSAWARARDGASPSACQVPLAWSQGGGDFGGGHTPERRYRLDPERRVSSPADRLCLASFATVDAKMRGLGGIVRRVGARKTTRANPSDWPLFQLVKRQANGVN